MYKYMLDKRKKIHFTLLFGRVTLFVGLWLFFFLIVLVIVVLSTLFFCYYIFLQIILMLNWKIIFLKIGI